MSAIAWDFPEAIELEEIEQITLPKLESDANSPFLENFPDEPHEDSIVRWEQEDNYTGVMTFRGYGGEPGRVSRVGQQGFIATPGVYGEFIPLEEEELTRRRRIATFGTRIGIRDLVAKAQRQLLTRRIALKEKILADLVVTGTYSVPDGAGQTMKTDSYTPQTYAAANAWSDPVNSTPLADIQAAALVPFGQSVDTMNGEIIITRPKFNQLTLNRNSNDIWGYRQTYGETVTQSLDGVNRILLGQGLPKIRVYDGFFLADNGTRTGNKTRFMTGTNFVLFGRRTSGAKPGAFAMTWNLAAGGAPRPYMRVIDRTVTHVPGTIEVHDGFNGGPLLRYPGTIVVGTGI